ncbi:diacylglycerol/lipid kinase family protein [Chloroflexota bacterium]
MGKISRLSPARVIVNPVAGAGRTTKKWPQVMARLKSIGLRFEHDLTEAPGHAVELARSAVNKGYRLVVSVGGDGTIHEIVNGLHDTGGMADTLLSIISTGTGHDYIRTIGIPHDHMEACRCLTSPRKLTVDLGMVEYLDQGQAAKRLFVNFAGLGFDAEVVKATTQRFKALGALPSYLLGLLITLVSHRGKQVSLRVDGEVEDRKVCLVLMGNGKYGGGGMLATPDADLRDGFFDVLIIDDLSKPDLLWSLPRVYRGTHLTHPRVTVKRVREIEVLPTEPMSLQADGELLGEVPARFQVLPAALNLIV